MEDLMNEQHFDSTPEAMPMSFPEDRDGSVRIHSGSGFRFVVPFPWRLHQILDEMHKAGDRSIICWQPDGRHFQVINPTLLMQKVVPKFFKQKTFKSFQRQLHIYGFQRVGESLYQGYYHEKFVQGNKKLCLEITRIKAPPRRRLSLKPLSEQVKSEKHASRKSNSEEQQEQSSSVDTTEWLISAGVPFSALDPFPVEKASTSEKRHMSILMDCAEEISSIFK